MAWIDEMKQKLIRRVRELDGEDELAEDLITETFYDIMEYSNASAYNTNWDFKLLQATIQKYNGLGVEGSVSRSANGVSDSYSSTDISGAFIASNIPQYIKPVGYKYPTTRFDLPQ